MTCSKLSIETEEQDVKYVKYDAIGIILVSFLLTLSPIALIVLAILLLTLNKYSNLLW